VVVLVDAQGLKASRPNRPLFVDLDVTVSDGDRIGVVGLNGCGKSTLLRMLAGEISPESGEVRRGRGLRLGFLGQNTTLPPGTIREAIGAGWQGEAMLDRLGMAALIDARTDELSGGQLKRVALATLLAGEYDLLILDEPTNHLDLDAISFLEERLAAFAGGLILVTHDRHVLDRVTNKVLEIDRGKTYMHVPRGANAGSGYAAYLDARAEREEQAVSDEQTRRVLARKELAWLRRGAPARSTKPKARIASATAIVEGRKQAAARTGDLGLSMGTARLGSKAIELHDISFRWPGSDTDLLKPFSHILEPGDRLGIMGANGSGKSTLLDILAGRREPTSGSIERGSTVVVGYYDQLGRALNPDQRVREAVAGPTKPEPTLADKQLMERFWFDGDAQYAPIYTLSGGERRRLQLLLTLVDQPNVLMLDEPTNDLDLDTLRALEDFLEDWPGALIVVSHDRSFVDRTIEEVLALDGHGGASLVRGGVAGWMASRTPNADGKPHQKAATLSSARRQSVDAVAANRPTSTRSPSTLRRLVGQAERSLSAATKRRDELVVALSRAGTDHRQVGFDLAAAQAAMDAAEEQWLTLAHEAESVGVTV